MSTIPESRRPGIYTAEGFEMPEFNNDDADTIEEVFTLKRYTSAPLISKAERERIFGHPNPPGVVGPYRTNGFVIYSAVPMDRAIGVEGMIAPSPDMTEKQFLEHCLSKLTPAMPTREDFPVPLGRVAAGMSRVGLRAVAGMNMSVSSEDATIAFPSLFIPRLYMSGEFKGPTDPEPRHEFAIKLAAVVFASLTLQQLKTLDAETPPRDN
ncbi:MAG TPA: hypothetical protein VLA88_02745 [Candidatus Saccharimonadales bacterium]|nr:hypothetical protein [Candidatus Saccharimonadales bacterium]